MGKKLTKEIVNLRISDRSIELIGDYSNKETVTTFKCKHGHEWEASPGNVMRGTGCPHCSAIPPLTKDRVNKRLADRGIELIGEYISAVTKTTFRCENGHEWSSMPSNVISGSGCPYCANGTYELIKKGKVKRVLKEIL